MDTQGSPPKLEGKIPYRVGFILVWLLILYSLYPVFFSLLFGLALEDEVVWIVPYLMFIAFDIVAGLQIYKLIWVLASKRVPHVFAVTIGVAVVLVTLTMATYLFDVFFEGASSSSYWSHLLYWAHLYYFFE